MSLKITMIGAGSPGFSNAVAKELCDSELLRDSTFTLMDIDAERLQSSEARIRNIIKNRQAPLVLNSTLSREEALDGCDYVITSCEKDRIENWQRDLEIPAKYGVNQLKGENGGPGGQIHAMRNISLFMNIAADMKRLCPYAWMMNITNPMSFICTYMMKHTGINTVGQCHQVHGTTGVIAEMLGMNPGDLEVVSAGINHMNWLIDIRRKGSMESFKDEFFELVKKNVYWKENHDDIPNQRFTLEILETTGMYPIGYDDHIIEYLPFFSQDPAEWRKMNFRPELEKLIEYKTYSKEMRDTADDLQMMELNTRKYPFPKKPSHPYYHESVCNIIESMETGTPLYLESTVVLNRGAVENLPYDAVLDIPTVTAGGKVRSINIGKLPEFCAELCRRQITIHEMVVNAVIGGDRQLALQALCLDPYIRTLSQARNILKDFLEEYKQDLPQFF